MAESTALEFDVVVLGGGFAGVYGTQALERALGATSSTRIALIAEENYMVFQPMLPEVAGGSLSPRHVVNPLRLLCRRAEVLKGTVESVDWPGRKLVLTAGAFAGRVTVRFRQLVVALGAVVDLSRIPGMPEHAFLMQNVGDAMLLRSTLISRFEEAVIERRPEVRQRLLTFVVVGGGYSGVETAGQIVDLFRGIDPYYANVSFSEVRVILVHSGERLLPTLNERLADYCARVLRKRGLDLRLQCRVKAVTATQVILHDGTTIPAATVISTVGTAPHPVVLDLIARNQLQTERGRIVTDEFLRVPGHEGLWAAGDCAAVPFIKGGACPPTAQFAYREGRTLGCNLAAQLGARGKMRPFEFKGLGELAAIGHRAAVASVMGFNFSGFIAWWMWRTIYLSKLPRFDRKLRVVMEWTLDLFFPRDINQLSPRYSTLLKEIHLEPGDVLFTPGEPAFSLYVVKSGKVELSDERGVVSTQCPGDYFGERALLNDGMWQFTGCAAEPTQLVSIPAPVFRQIVGGGGSLGRLFEKSSTRHHSREVIDAIARRLPEQVLSTPARDIMQTELATLRPEQSIAEAMAVVRTQPHTSYPVINDGGRFAGILRREDFHDFLKDPRARAHSRLADVGLGNLPSVGPDAPVRELIERLIRSGANKVVVLGDNERLLGIVTIMDLANAAAETAESEAKTV